MRRRPVWPWLLALVLLVAAGVGGWYAYTQVEHQLSAGSLVSVPFVESVVEPLAVKDIASKGLKPKVVRQFNSGVAIGHVFKQDPAGGQKIPKGNIVTIYVSEGAPQVTVPNVKGKSESDATSLLADRGLHWHVVPVPSNQPQGTVIAQDPGAGARVKQGSTVRLNVASGPQPVGVPPVVGQSFDQASATLQGAGFAVRRMDVDSNEPAGTVIHQDPGGNTIQPKGSVITLSVSKGPTTTAVPDVTTLDQDTATAQLRAAGFKVSAQHQDTQDPTEDGVVLSQNPSGGAQAKRGATVTIVVGRLVQTTTTTTTTTTTGTP